MIVGVMQVEIAIDWSQSLKDKRRVVKSLRDTLHRHHMVSVSEVEDHEILNRATLGIAIVGVSGGAIGVTLDRVLERIRTNIHTQLTPVVVLTARDMTYQDRARELGAQAYLQKPVDNDTLLETVARYV